MSTEGQTINQRAADQLRQKIQSVVEAHSQGTLDIGWALWECDHTLIKVGGKLVPVWQSWGYANWNEFVGKEFDMYPKTAENYMRVWETFFIDLQGCWDANLRPGITKFNILCGADINKRNVNKWVKKACNTTCRKLRAEIYGEAELRCFSVDLSGRKFNTVKKAIQIGYEVFGEDLTRGEIVAKAFKEWMMSVKAAQGLQRAS